jgi:hypothetical protein
MGIFAMQPIEVRAACAHLPQDHRGQNDAGALMILSLIILQVSSQAPEQSVPHPPLRCMC